MKNFIKNKYYQELFYLRINKDFYFSQAFTNYIPINLSAGVIVLLLKLFKLLKNHLISLSIIISI
jgi:hypothetical protein